MNIGQGQAHESHFGPPSEFISVAQFLQSAVELEEDQRPCHVFSTSPSSITGSAMETWNHLSPDEQLAVAVECGVDDLRKSLVDVIHNPMLMAHVTKTHEASVHSIYETADQSNRRKRKRPVVVEPAEEHADVTALRLRMESSQLKSSQLTLSAASFIRPPKHSDHNTLLYVKQFAMGSEAPSPHEAVIFVTIYNRLLWGHRLFSRSSQHVMLSSQTLGDMYDVVPCSSSEIPKEIVGENGVIEGYQMQTAPGASLSEGSTGCAILIDGVLYGDGQDMEDYSDRILKAFPRDKNKYPHGEKGASMYETTFNSLTLQLHKPYWLLHAGNCEHFFEIEQIRLHHTTDPPHAAYPLTTQITPPLLDLCRACNKVPAVYSVLGDVRLGESPFVICVPCWRWMGAPKGPEAGGVVVVPLPKHEHAWCG
ncbi:snRNA-activating protein of 50kDa MW C terminal-domain-containing protein [Amylocystis lapponica]|nr:snRNA-activating protein of 50kDa MW C terminal-domain-containing protein [Amylocystis lapponica]